MLATRASPSSKTACVFVAKKGGGGGGGRGDHGPRRCLRGPRKLGMRVGTSGANKITNNAVDLPLRSINQLTFDGPRVGSSTVAVSSSSDRSPRSSMAMLFFLLSTENREETPINFQVAPMWKIVNCRVLKPRWRRIYDGNEAMCLVCITYVFCMKLTHLFTDSSCFSRLHYCYQFGWMDRLVIK